MQIPARLHYATLAMYELAAAEQRVEPVAIREIVAKHGIPQPFLVQILQQLKSAGWVTSTRGSGGGYRLTAGRSDLTLLEIADAIGCGEGGCNVAAAQTEVAGQLMRAWDRAAAAYRDVLASITLTDLVNESADLESTMFYI